MSHFSEDVTSVLPAVDILEQCLIDLVYSVDEEDELTACYKQGMSPYQIEAISAPLIMRWINNQVGNNVSSGLKS